MDDQSTQKVKISGCSKTYRAVEMTDESVYELAAHDFTQEEIAELFHTTRNTLLALHGDAFNAGKQNAKMEPRIALRRIIKAHRSVEDGQLLHKDIAVERILKAIELHARKYEGLGQKQEVTHTYQPLDPSKVHFNDLDIDNVDKPWVSE